MGAAVTSLPLILSLCRLFSPPSCHSPLISITPPPPTPHLSLSLSICLLPALAASYSSPLLSSASPPTLSLSLSLIPPSFSSLPPSPGRWRRAKVARRVSSPRKHFSISVFTHSAASVMRPADSMGRWGHGGGGGCSSRGGTHFKSDAEKEAFFDFQPVHIRQVATLKNSTLSPALILTVLFSPLSFFCLHPLMCFLFHASPWPYTIFQRGFDLVMGEQPSDRIFR